MVIQRWLFEDEVTVLNGQTLSQNGDTYCVYDVDGNVIKEGKVWRIDQDLIDMSKESLQIEVMKLRTKIGREVAQTRLEHVHD